MKLLQNLLESPDIRRILQQTRLHSAIHRQLSGLLPRLLADHCLGCVARDDRLIVYTDSPAWATQLRFTLAPLLAELKSTFHARWQRVTVKVLPHPVAKTSQRRAPIPGDSIVAQMDSAAAFSSSTQIRSSLLRLTATWRARALDRRRQ